MPGMAQHPAGERRLAQKIRDLGERIRKLETNNRNASSSIPSTGTFTAGTTATGQPALEVSQSEFGGTQVLIRRDNGTIAFRLGRASGIDVDQRLLIYDRDGVPVAGDSFLSPSGMDMAAAPLPWTRVAGAGNISATGYLSTTAASMTALWESYLRKWAPAVDMSAWVQFSDATTAAEIELFDVVRGTGLPSFLQPPVPVVVAAGSTAEQEVPILGTGGRPLIQGAVGDASRLQLRARRTAGAGTVSVRVATSTCGSL